jgi:hypothetical protein
MALVGALVMTSPGCGLFGSDAGPEAVMTGFLGALASGDTARAAAMTDSPNPAKEVLDQARTALAPQTLDVEVQHVHASTGVGKATADYKLGWHLPHDRLWSYAGGAELYSGNGGWKVRWQPAVLHPRLAAEHSLAVRVDIPQIAPVLDRDGAPLLSPQTVVSVILDPGKAGDLGAVAEKLAAALNRYDPTTTRQSIVDGAGAVKDGGSYQVVTLRGNDYQRVKPAIYDLPGVRFSQQDRVLAADKQFGRQVLPAIRSLVEAQVAGRTGWWVVTVGAAGDEVANSTSSRPNPPARSPAHSAAACCRRRKVRWTQ